MVFFFFFLANLLKQKKKISLQICGGKRATVGEETDTIYETPTKLRNVQAGSTNAKTTLKNIQKIIKNCICYRYRSSVTHQSKKTAPKYEKITRKRPKMSGLFVKMRVNG